MFCSRCKNNVKHTYIHLLHSALITTVSTAACSCRRSVQVVTAAATATGDEMFSANGSGCIKLPMLENYPPPPLMLLLILMLL